MRPVDRLITCANARGHIIMDPDSYKYFTLTTLPPLRKDLSVNFYTRVAGGYVCEDRSCGGEPASIFVEQDGTLVFDELVMRSRMSLCEDN